MDIVGQVGDVDARVAFTGDVEVIFEQVGELGKKHHQGTVVIMCNCTIIGSVVGVVVITEAYSSWR